jgi:hypothetical protein
MKLNDITKVFEIASKDTEKNVENLKRIMIENDYKPCSDSARVFLSEMADLGMDELQKAYWESLALIHLPQHPWEVRKEIN